MSASAMSFYENFPSYSLFCKEDVIKSEIVDYEISSIEESKITAEVSYQVEGIQGKEYTFYVPVNCQYYDVPEYDVMIDGVLVQTRFMYGEPVYMYQDDESMEEAIERSSYGELGELITGTLYKFTANSETLTVSFILGEKQSVIFESRTGAISTTSGISGYSFTVPTEIGKEYKMFVTSGDVANIDTLTPYTKESKTCKEYVDENYALYEDFYSESRMPIELFYAKMNKQLSKKEMIGYMDFFWQNHSYSLNFYTFTIKLEQPTANITYVEKTTVQTKATFEPTIYMFERKKSANYQTVYSIEMTQALPCIVESNIQLQCSNNVYKGASTDKSFYCVFSSGVAPIDKSSNPANKDKSWIIIASIIGGCLLMGSIIFIVFKKKGN